jgi:hypothetical protein
MEKSARILQRKTIRSLSHYTQMIRPPDIKLVISGESGAYPSVKIRSGIIDIINNQAL